MDQHTTDSPAVRRSVPRLYHKKSRLGCLRCKGRRVKCDERRPVCSGCARHDVECVYPTEAVGSGERVAPKRKRAPEPSGYDANVLGDAGADDDGDADTMPESRGRRMAELRLLHHYLMTQSRTFGQRLGMWSSDIVRQALADEEPSDADADAGAAEKHDGILHALLAHAALSVWMGTDTTASAERRAQHRHLHQQYLSMALRAQRRAVDALVSVPSQTKTKSGTDSGTNSGTDSGTDSGQAMRVLADNVGSAALLLVNHSFALVQTLPVEPWQPPHEWLQMGRGAMQVMEVAKEYLGLGSASGSGSGSRTRTGPGSGPGPGPGHGSDNGTQATTTRTSISRDTAARALAAPLSASASPRPSSSSLTTSSTAATSPPSLVFHIVQSAPFFDPSDMFAPVWAAPFLWLLDEPSEPPDPHEPEVDERHHYEDRSVPGLYNPDRAQHSESSVAMRAYYETLSYIGWCAAAAERRDEPVNAICRRIAAAAYWFPEEFEERLDERRPRALVCLAQFFALWIPFEFTGSFESSSSSSSLSSSSTSASAHRPVWMMGTAGRRQVAAIHAALPARWKSKVAPLLGDLTSLSKEP